MKHKIKKVEDDISTKQQTNFVVYTHEDILSYLRSFDQINLFLFEQYPTTWQKKDTNMVQNYGHYWPC